MAPAWAPLMLNFASKTWIRPKRDSKVIQSGPASFTPVNPRSLISPRVIAADRPCCSAETRVTSSGSVTASGTGEVLLGPGLRPGKQPCLNSSGAAVGLNVAALRAPTPAASASASGPTSIVKPLRRHPSRVRRPHAPASSSTIRYPRSRSHSTDSARTSRRQKMSRQSMSPASRLSGSNAPST